MMSYVTQVILFQVLFLLMYDLFLSKETFFTKNRFYLIGTAIISFVLPLLKIPMFQKTIPQKYSIILSELVLSSQKIMQQQDDWHKSFSVVELIFWIGVLVFFTLFCRKIFAVVKLIMSNEIEQNTGYKLVWLKKTTKAFSFFNYIFLGTEIPKGKQKEIIKHELVHSQQKHSLDLLFFELLKIIMWFNPVIYLYQRRITLIHEFISDEIATKSQRKKSYINNLLSEVFQVEHITLINQFYKQSFIKKRIIMMTKNKSKQRRQLKYLLLIPLLAIMLFYTSCNSETNEKELNNSDLESTYENLKSKKEKISETTKNDVPFSVVDVAPTFPNCADGNKECFNEKMRNFIGKNFTTDLAKSLKLSAGKKRIYAQFKIDKLGSVKDVKVRAPHPALKEEVLRIINSLPTFKPAMYKGKTVVTVYTLPITFNVE